MTKLKISTSRNLVQVGLISILFLFPFLTLHGNPVLRMDIAQRTLFLMGAAVRIDQFFIVLLTTLVLVVGFLLMTVLLGRVWCGWLCPQTVFNDLVDMLREKLRPLRVRGTSKVIEHGATILLSAAVSFNLFCWFMSPEIVFTSILSFSSHPVIALFFVIIAILLYLNFTLVKRQFCRSYCPYGRFQTALLDDSTLNLSLLDETRDCCIRCGACNRVCPMDIDIREGFQIECINCGRCIDACRSVMSHRGHSDGLIAYRFGTMRTPGFRIGRKTLVLGLLICVLSTVLAWGMSLRSDSAFSVQRVATAEVRNMPDGSQMQAWRAIIGNHGESASNYAISISSVPGTDVKLLGQISDINIAPNENRQVVFFIRFSQAAVAKQAFELKLSRDNKMVSSVRVTP